VADICTMTKYTLQLVESRATIVAGAFNNILHTDKIPTSQIESSRHLESILFNNINLTAWINMSQSQDLNCRGRFFHPDKIHTSTSLMPVDITTVFGKLRPSPIFQPDKINTSTRPKPCLYIL